MPTPLKLSFLALAASAALFAQDTSRPAQFTQADRDAGAKTFRSHCSPCHGLNAEGGRGPNLAQGIFYRGSTDAELIRNISDGIPGTEMPGLFYSPDRLWQIIAYLRSLSQPERASGDPGRGAALFGAQGCAGCHRVEGKGGRTGPDLTQIGSSRSLHHLREAMTNPDADVRQRYWTVSGTRVDGKPVTGFLLNEDTYTVQWIDGAGNLQSSAKDIIRGYSVAKQSKMPSYAQKLTGAQLDDLVAYLNSLRRPGGSRP